MSGGRRLPHLRVVLGSRLFAILVLGGPILWNRDIEALLGLGTVATVWALCSLLIAFRVPALGLVVLEALLIGTTTGWFALAFPGLLAAVAFPALTAGLWFRTAGVVISSLLTTGALFAMLLLPSSDPDQTILAAASTWAICGLGVGLLTAGFTGLLGRDTTSGSQYREARELIQELTQLSSHLSSGLDSGVLAGHLLDQVGSVVPARYLQVSAVGHETLVPLATRSLDGVQSAPVALMQQAERLGVARFRGPDFAVPVVTRGVAVAVIGGRLPTDDPASRSALRRQVAALEPLALRLDTALLFAELREAATAGERNRLAREIHDGVAQEIASMGYLVDALVLDAPDPLADDLRALRRSITSVVSEVRRSVTTLRTQAGSQESLGAGVAMLARHLSESSGVQITVTVEESTERLRHEVEAELLRIAQEAMNNAVKHAHPTHIEVECRVAAPLATLTVRDHGIGLGERRPDSHGLTIMAERSALIGADLVVANHPEGGTEVRVAFHNDQNDAVPHTVIPAPNHAAAPLRLNQSPLAHLRMWTQPARDALLRARRRPSEYPAAHQDLLPRP